MNKFFLFLLFSCLSYGESFKWKTETNHRLYFHTKGTHDTASHRHSLEAEGTYKAGPFWTLHGGAKGYVEAAFANNESRYGAEIRQRESQDVRLKDAFLQYKSGGWTVKLGNQQVVWGEAFGFYYADFINPKDLRELGIGPLEKNRVSIPIANLKYVSGDTALQAVFIPKPYFHLTPAQGGDFSFPFESFFPGATLTHPQMQHGEMKAENFEGAVRASTLLGTWDIALFYGSYLDRNPTYETSYTSPTNVLIADRHDRVHTLGLTSSVLCGMFICRSELLWHQNRSFGAFEFPDLVAKKSDEYVGVIGIDYTESDRNHFGLQFSETLRKEELSNTISPRSQQNLSLHARVTTFMNQRFETIVSFLPNDRSFLVQAQYLVPLASRMELLFTGDTFFGEPNSLFGQYEKASRVGTILKIYLTQEN